MPTTGTYYARLTGYGITEYSLVATRKAAFSVEDHNVASNAQHLIGSSGVLGHVTGNGADAIFSLTGPVIRGPLIISGNTITLGIASDGSFIINDALVGIQFNGTEFVTPGSPVASFTVAYDGNTYTNNIASGFSQIAILAMYDISFGTKVGVRIVGLAGASVLVERVVLLDKNDDYVTIATRLTNISTVDLLNVATLESLDPDQDIWVNNIYTTNNDVDATGRLVTAVGPMSDLTIGLGSKYANSVVSAEGFSNTDHLPLLVRRLIPTERPQTSPSIKHLILERSR